MLVLLPNVYDVSFEYKFLFELLLFVLEYIKSFNFKDFAFCN